MLYKKNLFYLLWKWTQKININLVLDLNFEIAWHHLKNLVDYITIRFQEKLQKLQKSKVKTCEKIQIIYK